MCLPSFPSLHLFSIVVTLKGSSLVIKKKLKVNHLKQVHSLLISKFILITQGQQKENENQ
jgi:hypothetical protein